MNSPYRTTLQQQTKAQAADLVTWSTDLWITFLGQADPIPDEVIARRVELLRMIRDQLPKVGDGCDGLARTNTPPTGLTLTRHEE